VPNVDRERRGLQEFARDWFEDALCYGISYALVLAPEHQANLKGHATRTEERAAGIRPYVKLVRHDQVIGWQSQIVGGVERLTQVRIKQAVHEPDGEFGMRWRTQILVLEPGVARTHTQTANNRSEERRVGRECTAARARA